MVNIFVYYEVVKKNIKNFIVEYIKLVIDQNFGGILVFEVDFYDVLNKVKFGEYEK